MPLFEVTDAGGEEAAWLRKVLAGSNEIAVLRLSPEGSIEGWYGASERLFGYSAEEVIGRSFDLLFIPVDRERGLPNLELEVAAGTGRAEDDRWHLRKDGSSFWASGALTPQRGDDGRLQGFAKLLRDRTDVQIRFQNLINRVEALTTTLARQDAARLMLEHEMRNSLAALGQSALLLDRQVPADSAQRRLIDVALRQTQVMTRLLDDSVREGGAAPSAPPPRRQAVLLQEALRIATDSFEAECRAKPIQLKLYMPEAPVRLPADPEQLQRMLLNLLSNALKYTPARGHVDVTATVEGGFVAVRISDDGVGIAPENIERIFELFTRESDASSVGADGFGIGLAIVKRLATLHGGFVEARSAGKGKGSQFSLQLPLDTGQAGPTLPPPAAPES